MHIVLCDSSWNFGTCLSAAIILSASSGVSKDASNHSAPSNKASSELALPEVPNVEGQPVRVPPDGVIFEGPFVEASTIAYEVYSAEGPPGAREPSSGVKTSEVSQVAHAEPSAIMPSEIGKCIEREPALEPSHSMDSCESIACCASWMAGVGVSSMESCPAVGTVMQETSLNSARTEATNSYALGSKRVFSLLCLPIPILWDTQILKCLRSTLMRSST